MRFLGKRKGKLVEGKFWVKFTVEEWNLMVKEAIRNRSINWDDGCRELVKELNSENVFIANLSQLW